MMRMRKTLISLIFCILLELSFAICLEAQDESQGTQGINENQLTAIAGIVDKSIRSGKIPGAVVLIGNQGKVVYRRAFGSQSIKPKRLPMKINTIFDLSSLTKVIATTTAVMQLMERGKLRIEDRVSEHWPEFKINGKEEITVCQLLTHYSGLRPCLEVSPKWAGYKAALRMIIEEKPFSPPGTRFIYSDINFIILGELVHRISGQSLDLYCAENIFKPLGMKDTCFRPAFSLRSRIAPTQYQPGKKGKVLCGEVHDPVAYHMGGVAGHAGLFSTADDLAIFAQSLLNGGSEKGMRILSPLTVEKMTIPQTPPNKMVLRGLGWDIDSPFASNRGELFPVGSYGHTGFTGTSIWIDPVSRTYIILLTNRVHPDGGGDVGSLRSQIATLVASALRPISADQILSTHRSLTGYYEMMRNYRMQSFRSGKVQTGIDVLKAQKYEPLSGLRIGLITNHSGIDSEGRRTIDLLYKAPGVNLVSIFVPEHGLSGKMDEKVSFSVDPATDLPIHSLYGQVDRPTEKMLNGLNGLVFDIQDAGTRFYTYITTMAYAMEASAKKGIAFYVLDRPNPITASAVQGPVLNRDLRSFTGCFPMPLRHGMTVAEIATMFNAENRMNLKLRVIKMRGYQRTDWYDETGLLWVNPSPNLRTLNQTILYPGVAVVEGANVSVGRGTDTPFELLGAPWVNARELADYLNGRKIQGVRFMPVEFIPRNNRFENQLCHGVQVILVDRHALDSPALGVEIASALYKLYPNDFQIDKTLPLIGSCEVLQAIKDGQDPSSIIQNWQAPLEQFCKIRSKYLLY
ncbi:MAG: exo-beta-N-acetylmuramidase NamZ domain-containing protein [Thermodesulfobacteriota bacterium]